MSSFANKNNNLLHQHSNLVSPNKRVSRNNIANFSYNKSKNYLKSLICIVDSFSLSSKIHVLKSSQRQEIIRGYFQFGAILKKVILKSSTNKNMKNLLYTIKYEKKNICSNHQTKFQNFILKSNRNQKCFFVCVCATLR